MPTRLHLALQGNLQTWINRETKVIQRAVDEAVKEAAEALRIDAKAQVAGTFGPRLGNAAFRRVLFYSDTGKGKVGARAYIGSRVPEIIITHEQGMAIGPRTRKRLAIPLSGGPERGRGAFHARKLTPANYEKVFGVKLIPVPIGRGRMLLIDPGAATAGVMRKGKRKFSRRASARKKGLAVFLLVTGVYVPKRLTLRDLERRAQAGVGFRIEQKLNAVPQPRIAA